MTPDQLFRQAMQRLPLVAILRGVRPEEIIDIAAALIDAGFAIIEVPLNSPDPLTSIARLNDRFGDRALVGAGTVLTPTRVGEVAAVGGRLIVSPNSDVAVIAAAAAAGLVALPGFATPTEAFMALNAGAHGLKLFPAEGATPAVLKAMKAVLPPQVPVLPVGGITDTNMADWVAVGAAGFGLGGSLYKPGDDAHAVGERAARLAAAWRDAAG